MSHAYAARGTRQTAVLAAIVGLHFAVFIVIALGLHPRPFEVFVESRPITKPLPPNKPEPVVDRPDGNFEPGQIEIVVSKPDVDSPVIPEALVTDEMSTDAGSIARGDAGTPGPVVDYVSPMLRTDRARLSALIDSCYPAASRRLGEEGKAITQLTIGTQGSAVNWHVAESSGFPRLDAATACVIRKLVFVAGRRDGQAIAAEVRLPIVFRLN